MTTFRIRKSLYGNYLYLRIRDDNGNEDTVAQYYTGEEARRGYARMVAAGITAQLTAAELETQIAKLKLNPPTGGQS